MITAIILHYQLTNGPCSLWLPITHTDAEDSVNFKSASKTGAKKQEEEEKN